MKGYRETHELSGSRQMLVGSVGLVLAERPMLPLDKTSAVCSSVFQKPDKPVKDLHAGKIKGKLDTSTD